VISKLRAKPGGAGIEVLKSSFAEFKLDQRFQLIYVVFNTFFGLLTQDEQVSCFRSVRAHLSPGGVFLLEVFIPDLCRFVDNQTVRATNITADVVRIEVTRHDPVAQQITNQHVLLSENGVRLYPVKLRYAWPTELDLMAQLAGLSLRHRWGSWTKDPFSERSKSHISVYGLAD